MEEVKEFYKTANEIERLISNGQEAQAAEEIKMFGNSRYKGFGDLGLLSRFYTSFADSAILYDCIIEVYTGHTYRFPKQIIMKAKQIAPNIPDSIRYNDLPRTKEVAIYRATASSPEQAKNEISWTINKDVAIWFAYRHNPEDDTIIKTRNLYQGVISYDKIIAYYNGRSEFEVMQHRNVRNITEIFVTDDEVRYSFEQHRQHIQGEV